MSRQSKKSPILLKIKKFERDDDGGGKQQQREEEEEEEGEEEEQEAVSYTHLTLPTNREV